MAVLALAAGAALAQQRPESLLPPGFNETQPQQPAEPAQPRRPRGGAPAESLLPAEPARGPEPQPAPMPTPPDALADLLGNSDEAEPAPLDPAQLAEYELPSYARRSLDRVGIVPSGQGGLPDGAFGSVRGPILERLMERLDAPLPSRWMSIALRRALASEIVTPRSVNGADFAAERAWLLLRMGEAQVARALIEAVDGENYTPKMYEAAMQVALASGDIGLVCPVVNHVPLESRDRAWKLAGAMCGALSGVADQGQPQIDAARRQGVASGIDLRLAEKIVGVGTKKRDITIEWDGVNRLTAWRYGLATAGRVEIPESLFQTVSPRVRLWRAQMARPAVARAADAQFAATQGILSSAALVDLYGEIDQSDDPGAEGTAARNLRQAFVGADRAQRATALQTLWNDAATPRFRYARLILTASAAAALAPATGSEADRAIAAMLSAGYGAAAERWRPFAARGSDGWAMLTIADASGAPVNLGEVRGYRGNGDAVRKRQILFASLAGFGRISDVAGGARALAVNVALDNSWTRAIDRAAAAGDAGTVTLLAALGMQTPNWTGVPPEAMYHIVAGFHRVGLDSEARMIAVEALTRL